MIRTKTWPPRLHYEILHGDSPVKICRCSTVLPEIFQVLLSYSYLPNIGHMVENRKLMHDDPWHRNQYFPNNELNNHLISRYIKR